MPWPIPVFSKVEYPKPISFRVWVPPLIALAAGTAGAVLLLWPHGKPTQTIQFWSLLIGAPLIACAFAFGVRLNPWEHDQTVAEETEQEQQRIMGLWRTWCRRKLYIVSAAAFLPVEEEATSFSGARADLPVNLDRTIGFTWARNRSLAVRRTRLIHLVGMHFSEVIRGRQKILVTLMLDSASNEHADIWTERVQRVFKRFVPDVVIQVETQVATGAAQWLTKQVDLVHVEPRLVIAAQMWPDDEVDHAFSEGGAALLIDPSNGQAGYIFRPMTSTADTLETDMQQLVQMQIGADRVGYAWFTGCPDDSITITGVLSSDPKAPLIGRSVDHIVGLPGQASNWIALATAVEASNENEQHVVAWREPGDESLYLCMVGGAQPQDLQKER
ncbi:hypothetical protein DP57_5997 [Burkholderia pseudomallei]|uniref:hypothetical protein n=1 Tax=Burkholderia pseudomallei TaxID=28450 RepID=UPI00050FB7D9|nr:hypothetical protein [Burkholderia pseudomallei]KGC70200.1 hypothetical protein DP57_5997 [Burkholderia pseudomallei]